MQLPDSPVEDTTRIARQFDDARDFLADNWFVVIPIFAVLLIGGSMGYAKMRRSYLQDQRKVAGWVRVLAFVLFSLAYWLLLGWVVFIVGSLLPGDASELVSHVIWRLVVLGIAMFIGAKLVWPVTEEDEPSRTKEKDSGGPTSEAGPGAISTGGKSAARTNVQA